MADSNDGLRPATPEILAKYMKMGLNILLIGAHGVGKTAMLKQAAEMLSWEMRYFNAPTLDPYIHLVGIPDTGLDAKGRKGMDLYRDRSIDDVDVVFIDELNRGQDATTNGALELVNDRAINGERLPNLKSVVAGCNPANGKYKVHSIDEALMDRFDVTLSVSHLVSEDYLAKAIGNREVAKAFAEWQHNLDFGNPCEVEKQGRNKIARAPYVSPRRIEKMARNYMANPTKTMLKDSLGTLAPEVNVGNLFRSVEEAREGVAPEVTIEDTIAYRLMHSDNPSRVIESNIRDIVTDRKVLGNKMLESYEHADDLQITYDKLKEIEGLLLAYVQKARNDSEKKYIGSAATSVMSAAHSVQDQIDGK